MLPDTQPTSSLPTQDEMSVDLTVPVPPKSDLTVKIVTIAVSIGLIWLSSFAFTEGRVLLSKELLGSNWRWFTVPFGIMAMIVVLSYVYKSLLWWKYKPMDGESIPDSDLPTVTVVIPAYNEGPMVRKSMGSAMTAV